MILSEQSFIDALKNYIDFFKINSYQCCIFSHPHVQKWRHSKHLSDL